VRLDQDAREIFLLYYVNCNTFNAALDRCSSILEKAIDQGILESWPEAMKTALLDKIVSEIVRYFVKQQATTFLQILAMEATRFQTIPLEEALDALIGYLATTISLRRNKRLRELYEREYPSNPIEALLQDIPGEAQALIGTIWDHTHDEAMEWLPTRAASHLEHSYGVTAHESLDDDRGASQDNDPLHFVFLEHKRSLLRAALERCGLSKNEQAIITACLRDQTLLDYGSGKRLAEAEEVGRPYDQVRKEKERAFRKIREWMEQSA
jgi:hypothetical protein